jgi:hypothetical protein
MAMLAPREALMVVMLKLTKDGTYYLAYFSIEREDIFPKTKGHTSMQIPIGVWRL